MIIGLTGHIASGKSLTCDYLVEKYGADEYMMSRPLKEMAIALGFDEKSVYGTQEDKAKIHPQWKISAREFLQKFGTEICRNILPNVIPNMDLGEYKSIWLQTFINFYKLAPKDAIIVVSDVRFLNEADFIKKNGGIIIKLLRNVPNDSKHVSEMEMNAIKADIYINNNRTKAELYNQLDKIMDEHVLPYI